MAKSIRADLLETLEGEEILSIKWEGCVGVSGGKIIRGGEVIVEKPTIKQLMGLRDDLFENELGYRPGSPKAKEMFRREFAEFFGGDEKPAGPVFKDDAEFLAAKAAKKIKVVLWTEEEILVGTRAEAVDTLKKELSAWMNPDDYLSWSYATMGPHTPLENLPNQAYVCEGLSMERTDAFGYFFYV